MRGLKRYPGLTGGTARAVAVLLVFAVGCSPPPPSFNGEVVEPLAPAPPLAGVNWDGAPFRLGEQRGKVAVVFFGYTYCPDICPFTLAKLKQIYAELGERAVDLAVVFVSVDPRRDSLEKLSRYVPGFDRRFFGVRLEAEELDELKQTWDVTIQYGQPKDGPGSDSFYYVDHTGTYFIVDREGRLRLEFPPNASADEMLPDIEILLGEETAAGAPAAAALAPSVALEVREPRATLVPGGETGAVYLSIVNPGEAGDRLVSVETPAATAAETHETVEEDGVMRMVAHPGGFDVPPRGTLKLEPGGKHVMLIEPRSPEGRSSLPLVLHFERAGKIEVEAELVEIGMDHAVDHEGMDHEGMDHEGMDHEGMDHAGMDHGDEP